MAKVFLQRRKTMLSETRECMYTVETHTACQHLSKCAGRPPLPTLFQRCQHKGQITRSCQTFTTQALDTPPPGRKLMPYCLLTLSQHTDLLCQSQPHFLYPLKCAHPCRCFFFFFLLVFVFFLTATSECSALGRENWQWSADTDDLAEPYALQPFTAWSVTAMTSIPLDWVKIIYPFPASPARAREQ